MNKKLYVGGLPWAINDAGLRDAFSQAGTVVSATVIMDRMSGRSKGFGFVEMSSDEEARRAIELLHGKDLQGRTLTVNEARPMEDRPPRRDFHGGGSSAGRGFRPNRSGGGGYQGGRDRGGYDRRRTDDSGGRDW
ncbi:MAG: RNA-binding protein [bacterium]|nr:RNA-binding protein [bacterium]